MVKGVYTKEELYAMGPQRTFNSDAGEAAFLLGGIGTGNVSLGARGEFRDWEIFNKPGKGDNLDYTFFAIYAKEKGKPPIVKVLESRLHPSFSHGFGYERKMAGLPRFKDSTMRGEYPFVWIDFIDDEFPAEVSLKAYTPLIPLNPEDSGIPCAILKYKVRNKTDNPVDITIAGSLVNAAGICGVDKFGWLDEHDFNGNINEYRNKNGISGLYMYCNNFKEDHIRYGNLSIMTTEPQVTYKQYWLEGAWFDGAHDFRDDLCEDGMLEPLSQNTSIDCELSVRKAKPKYGSLGVCNCIEPGDEKELVFILSWYFPNRVKYWHDARSFYDSSKPTIKNHYGRLFNSSWEAGEYVIKNFDRLERDTEKFHKALFGSSVPGYVIDAVASNITVLRSPTCIWLEDGTFAAWEGCGDKVGSCFGSCTHVWNYAQTVAFLFPSLERSMRIIEFNKETDENGCMAFRSNSVFGLPRWDFRHPAADGQMGCVIRLYREWKISGDMEFLRKTWDDAKRALDFAFSYWDKDNDCVLDSQQHNTYDIEFYGPNSLTNSMFFAALKAGVEMSRAMSDLERAEKYESALKKGAKKMDKLLWNGEYYEQKIDDVEKYRYQYGKGCLSDQLLGQMMAHVTGLGYILPEEHVKKAVESIFKYNFRTNFYNHHNVQRTYAINDEKGLLLCSWPQGGRPRLPFIYSDEVWTGIEYQVAAHLIFEGFIDEGLTIVKAVRERHDGYRRNPWNEAECGHHYARSMASWAVLIALSGFQCDLVKREIVFSPKINKDNFSTFWSTGTAWGVFKQTIDKKTGEPEYSIDVLYGDLEGVEVKVIKVS